MKNKLPHNNNNFYNDINIFDRLIELTPVQLYNLFNLINENKDDFRNNINYWASFRNRNRDEVIFNDDKYYHMIYYLDRNKNAYNIICNN